jgi:hypothetical protein
VTLQPRQHRVLTALRVAHFGRVTVDEATFLTVDGWVDGYALCHPSLGGSEGLRRLRELRALGHRIDRRQHPVRGRTSQQYRLDLSHETYEQETLG